MHYIYTIYTNILLNIYILYTLLVNPSHSDESWEGRNTCQWIYIYIYYMLYLFPRATVMSPGKDETRVGGYIYIYIYIYQKK